MIAAAATIIPRATRIARGRKQTSRSSIGPSLPHRPDGEPLHH